MDVLFILFGGVNQGLIYALLAIGVYITYRILDIADLGIEGTFPLGGAVVAILISVGINPWIATFIAMIIGGCFGGVTGILHTKFKIPAILSGIITMTGLFTINMLILGGFKNAQNNLTIDVQNTIFSSVRNIVNANNDKVWLLVTIFVIFFLLVIATLLTIKCGKTLINIKKEKLNKKEITFLVVKFIIVGISLAALVSIFFAFIISGVIGRFSDFTILLNKFIVKEIGLSAIATFIIAGIILGAVFGICYWFFGTEIGMSLRATGNNSNMSKAQGINTNFMIVLGLIISNALVALAGAVFAQDANSANVQQGQGTIVIGLAAIVIGESIFGRQDFKKSLISVIVGSILYYILEAFAIDLNVGHYLKLVRAILITVVLVIPFVKKQITSKQKMKGSSYVKN